MGTDCQLERQLSGIVSSAAQVVSAPGPQPCPRRARKAVRVLVAEGLVYVVQGRGAYVTRHG